jgi:hypothetical protein
VTFWLTRDKEAESERGETTYILSKDHAFGEWALGSDGDGGGQGDFPI